MKRLQGITPFALLAVLSSTSLLSAAEAEGASSADSSYEVSTASRAEQLAADVRAIANDTSLSKSKRERRISTAVRVAVVAGTAYRGTNAAALGTAIELASAASGAAPSYAEVIATAAAFSPAVTRIDGAAEQIRAAAQAAARGGSQGKVRKHVAKNTVKAATVSRKKPVAATDDNESQVPSSTVEAVGNDEAPARTRTRKASASDEDSSGNATVPSSYRRRSPAPDLERSFKVRVGTAFDTRYDDNVYLASASKTHDVIVSATPNLGFSWGQGSLLQGSVNASEMFTHYVDKSADNVALTNVNGELDFTTGLLSLSASSAFQQQYQSITDIAATQRTHLERTDSVSGSFSVDAGLGAKTGLRTGVNANKVTYKNASFVGNSTLQIPFNLYYRLTPKSDVSLGYVYGSQKPDKSGPTARDHYFNVGAHGDFTPVLSGDLSVGYKVRKVAGSDPTNLLAFNGSLNYLLTAKTKAVLQLGRDVNASALGASTTNSSFRLGLNTDFTPQLTAGVRVGYLVDKFGARVFANSTTPVSDERTDDSWEGSLDATYRFSEWFSVGASYSHRTSNSTLKNSASPLKLDYDSNIVDLSADLHY